MSGFGARFAGSREERRGLLATSQHRIRLIQFAAGLTVSSLGLSGEKKLIKGASASSGVPPSWAEANGSEGAVSRGEDTAKNHMINDRGGKVYRIVRRRRTHAASEG